MKTILKEHGAEISLETLEGYLKKIGFSIASRGTNHYVIVNHKGKDTNLLLFGSGSNWKIEAYNSDHMFGGSAFGNLHMELNDLKLQLNSNPNALSFSASDTAFISLYNFDNHKLKESL